MKAASGATIALLASNQFLMAEFYTITLLTGTILYYTDASTDLIYSGHTYLSSSPSMSRDRTTVKVGISVDSINVTMFTKLTDTISGIPFPQFINNGGFDGASMSIDRCFMATYGDTSAGVVNIFSGSITDITPSRTQIQFTVSSALQLLDMPMPRNIYAPGCSHTVYDSGCGASKASFGFASTTTSGATSQVLNSGLSQAAGYFDAGTITFTSGANAGTSRTVKSYAGGGVFNLSIPLPYTPTIGDSFTAYAGCDKSLATCTSRFSRQASFRGFPYVPVPEASV